MNITTSTIYWLTRLDYVSGFFVTVSILLGTASIVMLIAYLIDKIKCNSLGSNPSVSGKLTAWISGVALAITVCSLLVPTTKEAAAMIVVPRLANSETVRGLGSDLVDLTHAWMKELRPGKEDAK